jgi:hypothetical protein
LKYYPYFIGFFLHYYHADEEILYDIANDDTT